MKQFWVVAILLSIITFLVVGCASSQSTADQTPKSAVPGEKVDGDERVAPGMGASGPNASVRW